MTPEEFITLTKQLEREVVERPIGERPLRKNGDLHPSPSTEGHKDIRENLEQACNVIAALQQKPSVNVTYTNHPK